MSKVDDLIFKIRDSLNRTAKSSSANNADIQKINDFMTKTKYEVQ